MGRMFRQLYNWSINDKTLWTTSAFLVVLRISLVTGVSLSPCGAEGIRELFYDQTASFTCKAEGNVQWRLQQDSGTSFFLSACDKVCNQPHTFDGLFTARAIDFHTTTININPINNTTLYKHAHLLNGSLECSHGDRNKRSARCGLHYVYPAESVVCTTSVDAWSVSVSCDIGRIYSSRGIYNCQLYRHWNNLLDVSKENVTIVISLKATKVSGNELHMTGVCQINTTLPNEEGNYSFSVGISPGRRNVSAGRKEISVVRPRSPTVSCGPQPYVLENGHVNCACNTTSLGQPTGYMVWIIGNQTNQRKIIKDDKHNHEPHRLHHTQTLTLLDHGNTWFRCDVIWGAETFPGNNYTAKVAYAARTPRLSGKGRQNILNQTVMERDFVHFVCESEGRPTPTVHIYNHDNNTELRSDLSPANYTFIARCEDAAKYKCYVRNEYSTQLNASGSVSFDLHVRCEPRNISSVDLGVVTFRDKTEELKFDVMAYPVPHEYEVWFVGRERKSSKDISRKVEDSVMNVTCKAHVKHRYLSRCTLELFSVSSQPGLYKVQVTNELGDQNFTVEIHYDYGEPAKIPGAALGGVAAAVVFTVATVVIIVVIVKKKKKKDSSTFGAILSTNPQNVDWNSDNDEVPDRTLGLKAEMASHSLQASQTPLYAVVHKTKKANKQGTSDKKVLESLQGTNALYAVVDKLSGQTPAQRGKGQRADDDQSPKTRNDHWKKVDEPWWNDDSAAHNVNKESLALHPLSSQREASLIRNGSSPAARRCDPDDGRWENGDGLIYTLPFFDVTSDVWGRPPSRYEKTEYCTTQHSTHVSCP